MFKWNSIVTSSLPLILISNAPSCASLYRPLRTPLDMSSKEPSIALTNATSSAPSSAMPNVSFLSPSYGSSMDL